MEIEHSTKESNKATEHLCKKCGKCCGSISIANSNEAPQKKLTDGENNIHQEKSNYHEAPNNGWVVMPTGCAYEGWMFEQREMNKKTVRFFKEYIHLLECICPEGKIPGKDITTEEFKNDFYKKIAPWKKYGAENW